MTSWRGAMVGGLLGLCACSTTAIFEDDETGGDASGGGGSGGDASGGDAGDTGGGGSDGSGGDVSDTGGSGGAASGGTTSDTGGADASGGDATGGLVAGGAGPLGLHGEVTDNGDGTVTLFYDFEEPGQLDDWTLSPPGSGELRLESGRLIVEWVEGGDPNVAAARFVRRLRVDELSFECEVFFGGENHVNTWIQAQGISDWQVSAGYDFVLNEAGRQIVADGSDLLATTDDTPVGADAVYLQQFTLDAEAITWLLDGEEVTYDAGPISRATTRDLGLGAYQSTVAFDDVTITGVLD